MCHSPQQAMAHLGYHDCILGLLQHLGHVERTYEMVSVYLCLDKIFGMLLLARISNLLEKQEKRMHDFSHSASLDVKNIADSAPDEKFLKEIISLIEKNITDSDYTTDSLAADMAMSRMSLYRKMKALTGQTPSDFIRTVRLKAAAELLKSGQRNVSEVCYLTGFATPQNFTKHFKDMFGVVPSQYRG